MSSEYTPSTEAAREHYTREQPPQIGTVSEKGAELDRWLAAEIRKVKAQAWDEGRSAEQEYRWRQDDAEAAGIYVQIGYPRNPYRSKPSCGCDLSGMTPPAAHLVDDHEGTGDER
ncbi:hypothetical protein [Nesterenkonia massiliensis]|uniref:hypothetical protein n=1 Tax=Nesterenkonia massiliensis TaxID=1232429 RepID=UPI00040660B1|nr:hypothetical protein [Nesterenkonia massiliensis]